MLKKAPTGAFFLFGENLKWQVIYQALAFGQGASSSLLAILNEPSSTSKRRVNYAASFA